MSKYIRKSTEIEAITFEEDVFHKTHDLKMMCPLIGCECEHYKEQHGDLTCDDCEENPEW